MKFNDNILLWRSGIIIYPESFDKKIFYEIVSFKDRKSSFRGN